MSTLPVCLGGTARGKVSTIFAFIIPSDLQLVAFVDSGAKTAMSLAEAVCEICRSRGVTSLNLVEHDMTQKTQEIRFQINTCTLKLNNFLSVHEVKCMIVHYV